MDRRAELDQQENEALLKMNKVVVEEKVLREEEAKQLDKVLKSRELYLAAKDRYLNAYKKHLLLAEKRMGKTTELIAMKDAIAALRIDQAFTERQEMIAYVFQAVNDAIREREIHSKATEDARNANDANIDDIDML